MQTLVENFAEMVLSGTGCQLRADYFGERRGHRVTLKVHRSRLDDDGNGEWTAEISEREINALVGTILLADGLFALGKSAAWKTPDYWEAADLLSRIWESEYRPLVTFQPSKGTRCRWEGDAISWAPTVEELQALARLAGLDLAYSEEAAALDS